MTDSTAIATRQQFDLSPQTFEQALTFSNYLADSDMVPKDFKGKPGNCLVAIQWGMEIGLKPLQAMQNIAVINGRPSLWGDAVIALVRSSSLCEYVIEEDDGFAATCRVKRRGEPEQYRTFSMDDAKAAGLLGKAGPWTQYPKRMRQMRARAFAVRDVFPDVLKGLPVAEEVQDMPTERHMGDVEQVQRAAPAAPQPAYTPEQFAQLLPTWRNAIAARKATADSVIGKIKTKGTLTAEQEAAIRAPFDQPATQAEPVTDVQPKGEPEAMAEKTVGERMHNAATLDALFEAADLIGEVADPEARARLTQYFDERKFALESE
ncbi:hypothetical protein [Acidovorax sp. RAC01]|uniref:hypothetical protein n=1 Tax=Acidovorax sp. RAC01 TaxID=1842533 RepID=UPI00083E78E8|nr:hypothetical protein [Acidovorax sp. RAC01]AOG23033.1 hypothetical protein BSY15_3854 [Acidovorax sp. RAC01]AOG24470.1 hypothetical protein BSY15_3776 [Acidovorax sp. RAC01]